MSHAAPIVVYGALRSGTTVFRLMLEAHGQLHNPGEADYLFDHIAKAPGGGAWRYDLEALALNRVFLSAGLQVPDWALAPDHDGQALLAEFLRQLGATGEGRLVIAVHRHLDRLVELLPDAVILHLLRDPRDVARSCIAMGWAGSVYHGVDPWIDTEAAWDRAAGLIPPAQRLDLRYEDLIAEPEARLRDVCDVIGVPFDPAMLRYHEGTTYGPPDPALINRWRGRIEAGALADLEGKLGGLLAARGYAPEAPRPRRPGRLRRARIGLGNKIAVWRFAMRRYGVGLVLTEKLSRRLGLRGVHRTAALRINERSKQYLK